MGMKKIKILKAGLPIGKVGAIVEVDADTADQICAPRKMWDGEREVEFRVAMPADEELSEVPISEMTAAQAQAAGRKNIVTPPAEAETPAKAGKKGK